jgi:DNA-binding NarL/FixJ family response regulator
VTRVAVRAASPVVQAGLEALIARAPDLRLVRSAVDNATETDAAVVVLDASSLRSEVLDVGDWSDGGASRERAAYVLITAEPEDLDDEAWRAGVRALVPIDAHEEEVLAAVRAVAAGMVALPVDVAESWFDALPRAARQAAGLLADPLSPREHQVLAMLAEGLGNKTIAARLGISRHTVKAHVSAIFGKLGAATRAEAVAIGARQGMIVL